MPPNPPDALLFITSGCPNCPVVLQGLSDLVKEGEIGKLTIVNVAAHPDLAAEHGVRSAPWLRLGSFTLIGAHTPAELRQWAEWSQGKEGTLQYIEHLLKDGGIKDAGTFVAQDTQRLEALLSIVADPDKSLVIRSGAHALLEAYRNTPELRNLIPQIGELAAHSDHRVRADSCHLLGLSGSNTARSYLTACLKDENDEVREIASESIALIGS